jgi:hypothetical protein
MIFASPAGGSIHHFRTQWETDMKATEQLHRGDQSRRLDNITRGLLASGTLERCIRELSITGLASNPSIFESRAQPDHCRRHDEPEFPFGHRQRTAT